MSQGCQSIRIAVNAMRARLTVVAFNLAVITFQFSAIGHHPGAIELPSSGVSLHLATDITLLMGVALCVAAMVAYIGSSALDEQGSCTAWSLLAGDMFMYLGLAHSVSGFFAPSASLLDPAGLSVPLQALQLETVRLAVVVAGGLVWFLSVYIGPIVSLLRSPCGWRTTASIGILYLLLVLATAHVSGQAVMLQDSMAGSSMASPPTLLDELAQPLRW